MTVFDQITDLSIQIRRGNAKRGFEGAGRPIGTSLMLITSELAEALEADRKGNHMTSNAEAAMRALNDDSDPTVFKAVFENNVKDSYGDELADAMIRLLDEAGARGIDIGWHVNQKLKYNATRAFKHGKNY